jgi:hypothetical protein
VPMPQWGHLLSPVRHRGALNRMATSQNCPCAGDLERCAARLRSTSKEFCRRKKFPLILPREQTEIIL